MTGDFEKSKNLNNALVVQSSLFVVSKTVLTNLLDLMPLAFGLKQA